MLAIYFIRWWLFKIWYFIIGNIFDYVLRFVKSFIGIILALLLFVIDIILGPIEIIAIISYCIYKKKN